MRHHCQLIVGTAFVFGASWAWAAPPPKTEPLTSVTHDATLQGNGTASSPLGIAPGALQTPTGDVCISFNNGIFMTIRNLGVLPSPGTCKNFAAYYLPVLSLASGAICADSAGASVSLAWTAIADPRGGQNGGAHLAATTIPLPLPNSGSTDFLVLKENVFPSFATLTYNASTCNNPMP